MTNYNEKLDKILNWQQRMFLVEALIQDISDTHKLEITDDVMSECRDEAKQAITSLIKELVAEAKPDDFLPKGHHPDACLNHVRYTSACCGCQKQRARNHAIDEFEQNLLKELGEV